MEETVIVIMLKDSKTGFLDKELLSCSIKNYDDYLLNAFAVKEENEILIKLRLTCNRDLQDWEFNAAFDYYDTDIYNDMVITVSEVDDCFNPTWELVFPYTEEDVAEKINHMLNLHVKELEDVFSVIADKRADYMEL